MGQALDAFDATSSLPEGTLYVAHSTSIDGNKHFFDPFDGTHKCVIDGKITKKPHLLPKALQTPHVPVCTFP